MTAHESHSILAPQAHRLHLGAAYYPEHWPEDRWPEDVRLMREAGLTVARMAEFAWSTLEPAEGEFHFDWLERAISLLASAGIVSVVGTPTAAPPAWLVHQHPDMLAVDERGRRVQFGNRCHYCVNAPEFHAGFDGFDHYALTEDLDLASWDWYVGTGHHDYKTTGAAHDLVRGFKRQNFWLMETQPGSVNWSPINNPLNRGEGRAMAWHAVAHGADAVLYWQWRSAPNGQEQYHGTLVDQSGQPRPFYEEVQQLGREFAAASPLLAGSRTPARVAILNSYDSRWSIQGQRHHRDFDYVAHLTHYYRPLAARNIAVDIVPADAPLKGYRLVIAPALVVLNKDVVEQLEKFVSRRGSLVLTIRCGMKDEYNALLPSRQPGPLADIAGVEVEEYYALRDEVPVKGNWFSGVSRLWAERLNVLNDVVCPIARYGPSNGWLDDQVGIAVNSYRGGLVYFVGTYLDEAAQQAFIDRILKTAGIRPTMETGQGVEVRKRVNAEGKKSFIVINHERVAQVVPLPWPAHEHLSGLAVTDELKLAPYGVALLTREE